MSLQDTIAQTIHDKLGQYQDIAKDIHAHPEVSDFEFHACTLLTDTLKAEGFMVEENAAGHRTGFLGCYDSHKPGPTIAFLVEYDALVGLGHGCGHNLFAANSMLSAVGFKSVVDEVGGKILVFGTPGEEGGQNGSAKADFVKEGYFNDVDVALCAHPGAIHGPSGTLLALDPIVVEFYGRPAHAASAPHEGINALDAMILLFNGVGLLRQQVSDDVRMHGIITHGGDAPNIIPEFTQAKFYIRALKRSNLDDVHRRFKGIVEGSALATGCTYKMELFQNATDDMVKTPILDTLYLDHLEALGQPVTRHVEGILGSSDCGNVSYVVPTIQPYFKISQDPIVGHTQGFKEAAISSYGLNAIEDVSKALAFVALDLCQNPELLSSVKAQHKDALEKAKL